MANGKKNKFSIDLGFNVTDQPSLSESSSDLPDTTKLKFDFSRPIDRVDIGSITEEPEDVTWYPTRGIFEGIEQTTKGIIGGIKYIPTVTNSDSKYDQIKALEDFDKLIKSAPPQAQFDEEPIRATGQFIGRLLPSAAPIMGGIVAKSPKLIYSGIAGLI